MDTEATAIGGGRHKFLFTNKHQMLKMTYNHVNTECAWVNVALGDKSVNMIDVFC